MDLGVWENALFSIFQGDFHLLHFWLRPIYLLYLPFYYLGGVPFLLFIQSLVVGLSIPIVYRYAWRITGDFLTTYFLLAAYCLYFPVWYICLSDFHADHWYPLLLGMLYNQRTQNILSRKSFYGIVILLLTIKEISIIFLIVYFFTEYLFYQRKEDYYLFVFGLLIILIICNRSAT